MNKQEELKGLLKESIQEEVGSKVSELEAKASAQEEANVKALEDNAELKTQVEELQGKIITLNTKTAGVQKYIYKGYNTDYNKNFKVDMSYADAEQIAKVYLDMAHGKAIDFASEMPQGYGSAIMGLSELSSSALSTMNVMNIDRPTFSAPAKTTRETSDSQASATASTATSITASTITWTIDERIGSYAEVRIDQLEDAAFDIVNGWVIPMQAEGIGQYVDAEVFNGTNSKYTTSIIDVTAAVTASGAVATAAAITFANLNTMFYHVEWERGLGDCKWYGSRAALKDIMSLTDTYGLPIMQTVPVNGRPVHYVMGAEYVITPVIANAPAAAAMRLCFGDPKHYTIMTRGGLTNLVNPYIKMREDVVQFIAKLRADGNVDDNATAASSGAWAVMSRIDS